MPKTATPYELERCARRELVTIADELTAIATSAMKTPPLAAIEVIGVMLSRGDERGTAELDLTGRLTRCRADLIASQVHHLMLSRALTRAEAIALTTEQMRVSRTSVARPLIDAERRHHLPQQYTKDQCAGYANWLVTVRA